MGRSKTGEAILLGRRTPEALAALTAMLGRARADGRLDVWLRLRAVLGYIDGVRVVELARQLDVGRTSINNWLLWYARTGADGLTTAKPGRSEPKLSATQREQLGTLIDAVFGAVSMEAEWPWQFSPVFNGHTFHVFLLALVEHFAGRKVFMVIDNGPCHWLDDAGKAWLAANGEKIELHRLPPYSRVQPPPASRGTSDDIGLRLWLTEGTATGR